MFDLYKILGLDETVEKKIEMKMCDVFSDLEWDILENLGENEGICEAYEEEELVRKANAIRLEEYKKAGYRFDPQPYELKDPYEEDEDDYDDDEYPAWCTNSMDRGMYDAGMTMADFC